MNLLIDSRKKAKAKSYAHLGELALGKYSKYLIDFTVVFALMGHVIPRIYVIVIDIADLLNADKDMVFVFCFIVTSLLCFIRKI